MRTLLRTVPSLTLLLALAATAWAMSDAEFLAGLKSPDAAARVRALNQARTDPLTPARVTALADTIAQDPDPTVRERATLQLTFMNRYPECAAKLAFIVPRLHQGMLQTGNTDTICFTIHSMLTGDPFVEAPYRAEWLAQPVPRLSSVRNAVQIRKSGPGD